MSRPLRVLGIVVLAAAAGVGAYFAVDALRDDEEAPPPAPAPKVVVHPDEAPPPPPEASEEVGFPAFATKNTTRVAGADSIAAAAGVALAVFPSTGGVEGPAAVSLVGVDDWAAGIAAASLAAAPVRAPILLGEPDQVPALTDSALSALDPRGSAATEKAQLFRIGDVAAPQGMRATRVEPGGAATVADAIDRLRQQLTGAHPAHIVLASARRPQFAMPAASWAARSGDPVLFVGRDSVPKPTLEALRRHPQAAVYLLAPESVVGAKAFGQIQRVAEGAKRIAAGDEVESSIAFARYADGSFGWDINDPGHGFVIANAERPLDAAAAAPLSASGTWGPLLVSDDASSLPPALQRYLLDVKPGYATDPTRALYNHAWLIGDERALSVGLQARVDELAEVAQVRSGAGGSLLEPLPHDEAPQQKPKGTGGK